MVGHPVILFFLSTSVSKALQPIRSDAQRDKNGSSSTFQQKEAS
jgi:hypothetical protein